MGRGRRAANDERLPKTADFPPSPPPLSQVQFDPLKSGSGAGAGKAATLGEIDSQSQLAFPNVFL